MSVRWWKLAGVGVSCWLVACAADKPPNSAPPSPAPSPAATAKTPAASASSPARPAFEKKFSEAVIAPLSDLNLVRTPIPPVLAAAQKAPYGLPPDTSCAGLAAAVEALDAVLDPDVDSAEAAADPTLADRGAREATDAVIGAVRNTTEGVIPFRGWVRKLTGAEKYAKEVAAALGAGVIRRAYLKGLGQAAGCLPPAAPRDRLPPPVIETQGLKVRSASPCPAPEATGCPP